MTTRQRLRRIVPLAVAAAGLVGLGLVAVPLGATAAPPLPPVSAQDLVSSVLTSHPGAFAGSVKLDNALGIPALPGLPQLADGTSTARVWSDGAGRGRLSVPNGSDERTVVEDGRTVWLWDSAKRSVTELAHPAGSGAAGPHSAGPLAGGPGSFADPAQAAAALLGVLQHSSTVRVDGTDAVAGRGAYDLVLTPAPSERTLLREVRIAVDAERRIPLQLTVLANGSTDPAPQVGFTELTFAGQDPALFHFSPPPGATVTQPRRDGASAGPAAPSAAPRVVGDGWDTVVVAALPAAVTGGATAPPNTAQPGQPDPMALLRRVGKPVSGTWGSGWLVSTKVASAIVTSDGRLAAGAVPEQVLTEALSR